MVSILEARWCARSAPISAPGDRVRAPQEWWARFGTSGQESGSVALRHPRARRAAARWCLPPACPRARRAVPAWRENQYCRVERARHRLDNDVGRARVLRINEHSQLLPRVDLVDARFLHLAAQRGDYRIGLGGIPEPNKGNAIERG